MTAVNKQRRKQPSSVKKIAYILITIFIVLILCTILGELFTRIFSNGKYGKPVIPPPYNTALKDEYLGWRMTPNYSYTGKMHKSNWEEYDIKLNYDENGFKVFGDTNSTHPKILFIGDSYTACIEVSNEDSFFQIIGDSLNVEVFSYGHAGYSTLQEYMILDQWLDQIKPDLIVWETCSNDFIGNHEELEKVCGYKVGERRPYLGDDGQIYYTTPLTSLQWLKKKIHFYAWLDERLAMAKKTLTGEEPHVGEYYISTFNRQFKPFDLSVRTTENIIKLAKNRIGASSKVLEFTADNFEPQRSEFERIFSKNGNSYTRQPSLAIAEKEYNGGIVRALDGYHWNNDGHKIVANELIPFIVDILDISQDSISINK